MEIEIKLPRSVSGEELSAVFEEEVKKTAKIFLRKNPRIMYEPGSVKERAIGETLTLLIRSFTPRWKWFIFSGGGEYEGKYHVKIPVLLSSEHYESFTLTILFEPNPISIRERPIDSLEYERKIESTLKKLLAGIYQNKRLESPAPA